MIDEERSIAEETRRFARRQLAEFRAAEQDRVQAYRQLRGGLRAIDAVISDLPLTMSAQSRERYIVDEAMQTRLTETSLHRKILDLTTLVEASLRTEASMRTRLEAAEARAAAAENKVIDLQARLLEFELSSSPRARVSPGRRA